jgi:hypothetical protein
MTIAKRGAKVEMGAIPRFHLEAWVQLQHQLRSSHFTFQVFGLNDHKGGIQKDNADDGSLLVLYELAASE